MNFLTASQVAQRFEGRTVALVGSGPGCLHNDDGLVDGHDVVVRVNNYKLSRAAGFRTDVHYSFYGTSIRKTAEDLQHDGVTLCMCKCPDAQPIDSDWHRANDKLMGIDFRYIYRRRAGWWFCDTYIPSTEEFMRGFYLLGRHVPTTGFSALITILACRPKRLYLTGFDFFRSGLHNVNERWTQKNLDDPIGHVPERELNWLRENMDGVECDQMLQLALAMRAA